MDRGDSVEPHKRAGARNASRVTRPTRPRRRPATSACLRQRDFEGGDAEAREHRDGNEQEEPPARGSADALHQGDVILHPRVARQRVAEREREADDAEGQRHARAGVAPGDAA